MQKANPKYYRLAWLFTLAIFVSAVTLVGAVANLAQALTTRHQPIEQVPLVDALGLATPAPVATASQNITVTAPTPYQAVVSPLTISGTARTFESGVNYRLKDINGGVVKEGYTTASSPEVGQFGPYTATLVFTPPATQLGTLEVFQYSAQDGTPIDMVIIPVIFG